MIMIMIEVLHINITTYTGKAICVNGLKPIDQLRKCRFSILDSINKTTL